jgi:hypothetical protein
MRVNLAAAAGALAGLGLAVAASARHPVQVVVAIGTVCAFLAAVSLHQRAGAADWFTVRLLLAANIAVFGISDEGSLGLSVTILFVAIAFLMIAGSLWIAAGSHEQTRRGGTGLRGRNVELVARSRGIIVRVASRSVGGARGDQAIRGAIGSAGVEGPPD